MTCRLRLDPAAARFAGVLLVAIFAALFAPLAHAQFLEVTNTQDSGTGSLRQAIQNSYLIDGCTGGVITFNIPGTGPHTISPQTELPALGCNASINGYSQPGATMNTDTGGANNANIQIIIDGSACSGCDGLNVANASFIVTIQGLSIHSFSGSGKAGIRIAGGGTANIYGNYLGTDPGGNSALVGNGYGIAVDTGSATIGYPGDPGLRNLITGNRQAGIWVGAAGPCALAAPWEPTSAPKAAKVLGAFAEIYNNLIGGSRGGLDTVYNTGPGIRYTNGGGCSFPEIQQNLIRFNLGDGIYVASGGDMSIASNSIYANSGAGVVVASGDYIAIFSNSIHSNGRPGIDLGDDGVTANDYASPPATLEHDMDSGANRLVNHPVILSVAHGGGNTHVDYEVKGPPFSLVRVEFFSNTSQPATPSGETPLGASQIIPLDEFGEYVSQSPLVITGLHDNISATATHDSCGECGFDLTSEFSPAVAAPAPPTVSVAFIPTSVPLGGTGTFRVVVVNPNTAPISGVGYTVNAPANYSLTSFTIGTDCNDAGTTWLRGLLGAGSGAYISELPMLAGGSCTMDFQLQATVEGTYIFPPGGLSVTSSAGTASNASPASLQVVFVPPVVNITAATTVTAGANAAISVFVSHPGGLLTYSGMSATLSFPGGGIVAPLPNLGTSCGASVSAPVGSAGMSATDGSVAPNSGCTLVTAQVNFPTPGTYTLQLDAGAFTMSSPAVYSNPTPITRTITVVPPPAPAVALSGSSLSFGAQTVDTSSGTQSITVTNSGTASLSISAVNVAGDFGFTGCASPLTLSPGASCTLSIYFFPTTTGDLAGSVSIVSNASGSPHVITLGGTGTPEPVPAIALAPSSANFGTILVGQSATQVLALSNPGTANLDISSISVIEMVPPPAAMRAKAISFTQTNDCPLALAPSAACNITVTYAPASAGSHAGELRIVSNAAPSPLVALLSGSANPATTADLQLSASSVTFAPQFPNTTSAAQSVTLTSSGTAPLVISQVTASGDFAFSGCGPSTLAPGATCSFAITFKPFSEGAHSGSIVITSNAPGSPHTLSLSGTGSPRLAPEISLSPSNFAFGAVRTPSTATLTNRLTNAGAASLEIAQISSTGSFFDQSNNCPSSLAIGAFCDITVTYAPTATGPHSGQLVIHSNALPSPYIVALSGTGTNVPPPFLDVDSALDFGLQVTGVTVRRTLTLANTGGDPLTISQMTLIGSGAFGLEGACASIAPDSSCDLTVTFTPMGLAAFTGRLDIVSNHSGGVVQVSLSGVGTALPRPALELSVGALGFGSQGVGSMGASQNVRLTSIGAAAAQIHSIAASLPDFVVDANQCPAVLAPQQSCDIGVAFKPVAAGGRQGSLVIQSDAVADGGLPHSVSLIGVGCRFFTVGGSRNPQRLCAP